MQPIAYRILFIEVAVLLLLATTQMPYPFYAFIRGVVVIAGIFLIVRAFKLKKYFWTAPASIAIVLFAAISGFEFSKDTWGAIDFIFAVVFFIAGITLGGPQIIKASGPESSDTDEPQLEPNDKRPGVVFAVISGIMLAFYLMVGTGGGSTVCPDYVQDYRGGYCE